MLFALCIAGAVVAFRNGLQKRSVLVLGIGFVAAVSIIPYLIGIHRVKGHYLITQIPYGLDKFMNMLVVAVANLDRPSAYVWGLLVIAAVAIAVLCQFRPAALGVTGRQKDLLLYSVTALGIGAVGIFLFLKNLSFGTQPWYYSSLMALAALAIDAILSVLGNSERGREVRVVLIVVVLGLLAPPVWTTADMRMTNIDLMARQLSDTADKNDLIVVNPWYCGISFQYYYTGKAAWTTLPELEDHLYHHYEPVAQIMMKPDQMEAIRSVLDRIAETLKAGHQVWLVGDLTYPPPGQNPPTIPPAPNGPDGWWSTPYQKVWAAEAGYYVQAHVQHYKDFIVATPGAHINRAEFMPLAVVQGWKD
jgi:hypothetical protein